MFDISFIVFKRDDLWQKSCFNLIKALAVSSLLRLVCLSFLFRISLCFFLVCLLFVFFAEHGEVHVAFRVCLDVGEE